MQKEESIGYNLGVIHNLIGRGMAKSIHVKKCPNITPIQIKILKYLVSNQDKHVYQKDIETIFEIRRSTVSCVLKTMEKNNMIKRVDSSVDARSKEIILTDEAKSKQQDMEKYLIKLEKVLTKGISNDEKKQFVNVLNKIQDNLKDYERNDI